MRLCLAGGLSRWKLLKRLEAPSVLLSFAELKSRTMDKRVELLAGMREDFPFIFCDSGAHSFFSEAGERGTRKRATSLGSPDEWFDDYLATILECVDYVNAWAELDIDSIVGLDPVLAWREKAMKAGVPREKYVPVFHTTLAKPAGGVRAVWKLWEEWCREFPYVATEGSFGGALVEGAQGQRRVLEKAKKHGAKLHSFATTSMDLLKRVNFFSVDSTSWLAGSMYGITYKLDRVGNMTQLHETSPHRRKKARERILKDLEREGVLVPQDMAEQYLEDKGKGPDYVNGLMFVRWEEFLTKRAKSRKANYWEQKSTPAVYDESFPCTCDSTETNCACKRHGVGMGGVAIAAYGDHSPEVNEARSLAMRGNTNALSTGTVSIRVPQVACDDCYLGDRCPRYRENSTCGFDEEFQAAARILGTRDHHALVQFLWRKLELDASRLQRGVFFEALDGGMISKEVEGLSGRLGAEISRLARMMGSIPTQPTVDARQVNLIINTLSDEDHLALLLQVAKIRDIAPELLEEPGEE